jgi:hypothetical protein
MIINKIICFKKMEKICHNPYVNRNIGINKIFKLKLIYDRGNATSSE